MLYHTTLYICYSAIASVYSQCMVYTCIVYTCIPKWFYVAVNTSDSVSGVWQCVVILQQCAMRRSSEGAKTVRLLQALCRAIRMQCQIPNKKWLPGHDLMAFLMPSGAWYLYQVISLSFLISFLIALYGPLLILRSWHVLNVSSLSFCCFYTSCCSSYTR